MVLRWEILGATDLLHLLMMVMLILHLLHMDIMVMIPIIHLLMELDMGLVLAQDLILMELLLERDQEVRHLRVHMSTQATLQHHLTRGQDIRTITLSTTKVVDLGQLQKAGARKKIQCGKWISVLQGLWEKGSPTLSTNIPSKSWGWETGIHNTT